MFNGCTTLTDPIYLYGKMGNVEKAEVLIEKGIEMYNTEIESKKNYTKLPEVKEYFIIALR